MKKSEKTELTKEKILTAAVSEFGTKGYDNGSINNICKDNEISKGLIYHNFKNKDDIYLNCVEYCLNKFIDFMEEQEVGDDLKNYMNLRYHFFSENPLLSHIFFEAVLQPPKHLIMYIKNLKRNFDEFNLNTYKRALKKVKLRSGVIEEEVIEYYSLMQEMFNSYFISSAYEHTSFSEVITDHETKLSKIIDFMLYGIAKEENNL